MIAHAPAPMFFTNQKIACACNIKLIKEVMDFNVSDRRDKLIAYTKYRRYGVPFDQKLGL